MNYFKKRSSGTKNLLTLIISVSGTLLSCADRSAVIEKKPNVLILFSDQHNKKVMGFEGHPDVITPNLDRLASESIVFDRAYCTVGICAPSRSSFMTGLYPRTIGQKSNEGHTSVTASALSMASIFKQNGYKTFAFGKRHTHGSIDEGWDVHRSHLCDESPGASYTEWVEEMGYGKEFSMDWAAEFGKGTNCSSFKDTLIPTADLGTRISELPENMTMEAFTTILTVEMIKNQANSDKPFFCWATFYRPHQPYTPLKKYMEMYDVSRWGEGTKSNSAIKRPESFYEPAENLPPLLQDQRRGGNKVWNMDKAFQNEQLWRNYIGAYYALVTEIDHCIGQILNALSEAGLDDETIVIYTSDHGDFVGNHGMVEKAAAGHNVYEDILNVPLVFRYPGKIKGGKRNSELVSLVDILPTMVEMAGLEIPDLKFPFQGISLFELIMDNKTIGRKYIVSESWSQATVITKDCKLGMMMDPTIVHPEWDFRSFGDMFFDLSVDPLETKNRIGEEKYRPIIMEMKGFYEDFIKKVPDTGTRERILEAEKRNFE